jgi:TonB family protein
MTSAFAKSYGCGTTARQVLITRHCRNRPFITGFAFVLVFTLATILDSKAASAVATATNPKTGRLAYNYAHGGPFTEAEQKDRVIQNCRSQAYVNPKVIASTSKGGYGAIVAFQTTDQDTKYAVSLAAATQQQAINDALQKAKATSGRKVDVVATWHDVSSTPPPPVSYHSPTSAAIDAKGVSYLGTHYGGPPPWMKDVIHSVTPDYPYNARAVRQQGTGLYRLILDLKTGAVIRVTIIRSAGFGKLDDSVITALRQWRWKPGKWKEIGLPVTFVIGQ